MATDLAAMYAAFPRKRIAAGALLLDRNGQVLVVEPTYKATWDVPGGVVEEDEAPRVACRREVHEELGLDRPVGGLLCVDWVPASAPRTEALALIFDGGFVSDDDIAGVVLQVSELASWRFVDRDGLPEVLPVRLARRMAAALAARRTGQTVYLEDGRP
ncbi:MAG: NUDIX domain-containing protein [Streptosporangiales bacterium]